MRSIAASCSAFVLAASLIFGAGYIDGAYDANAQPLPAEVAGGPETPADAPAVLAPERAADPAAVPEAPEGEALAPNEGKAEAGDQGEGGEPTVAGTVERFQDGKWLAGAVGAIFLLVIVARRILNPQSKTAKRVIAWISAAAVSAIPIYYGVPLSLSFVATMAVATLASGGVTEEIKDALRAKLPNV